MVCIKMRLKNGGGGILSEFYKVLKMIIFKGTNLHIIFGFVAPDRKEKNYKNSSNYFKSRSICKRRHISKKNLVLSFMLNSTVIFITIKKEELQTKEFKTVSQLPTRIELPNISFIHTQ